MEIHQTTGFERHAQQAADYIRVVRNHKVMLDSDLATLHVVSTKRLNEQVKGNADRFLSDIVFQLNESEWSNLRSQFVTASWGGR